MRKSHNIVGLIILIVTIVSLLGVSYAGYTNRLTQDYNLSTSSFNNIFKDNDNESVTARLVTEGNSKELEVNPSYDNDKKRLNIIVNSPIDISDFDNDSSVIISYSLKPDNDSGLKQVATVNNHVLGAVDFTLKTATPVCSIVNKSKGKNRIYYTGNIPEAIYDYLPNVLASFNAYHTILSADENGVMNGTITLEQVGDNNFNIQNINLSSLELDDSVNEKITKSNSSAYIEVEASYGFSIPIDLDQFNVN